MTIFDWPEDLAPFQSDFYLQSHSGGTESPFSRQAKTYGLSPPRYVATITFRTGWNQDSDDGVKLFGGRVAAMLAKLKGREHRVRIHDFTRPGSAALSNVDAIWPGDSEVMVTGGVPVVGNYIGGDGRPHTITDVLTAGLNYRCTVEPPFQDDIAAGAATFENVTATFRLASDDAASNSRTVGEAGTITLDLVEDLDFFRPAQLFIGDDDGYWLDFSNQSTLFKTAGFAAPVLALGDPTGQIRDLSGLNRHAGNSSLANQPVFAEAPNGLRGIYFDGVDDFLALATSIFEATGSSTFMAAVQLVPSDAATAQTIYSETGSATSATYYLSTGLGRSAAADADGPAKLRFGYRNDAAAVATLDSDDAFADDNPRIVAFRDNALTVETWIDDRKEVDTLVRAGALTLTDPRLGMIRGTPAVPGDNSFFKGYMFGVFGIDRVLTDAEMARLRNWFTAKYITPVTVADGLTTQPVLPRVAYYNGRPIAGTCTALAGIRVTDMSIRENVRGPAYSLWSMGAVAGDAHFAPAVLPLADGRLVVGWTGHNSNNYFIRISEVGSTTEFGVTRNFGPNELGSGTGLTSFTYASFVEMSTGVFTFVRAKLPAETTAERAYWHSKVKDPANAFPVATKLIAGNVPYLMHAKNGANRVDFLVSTSNPTIAGGNSLYHFYMSISPAGVETFRKSDGTALTLPMVVTDMTLIYDGTTIEGWIEDIAIGADGLPRVLFITYNDRADDQSYWHARWNGTSWVANVLTDTGGPTLSILDDPDNWITNGNASFDPDDPTVVFCGRKTAASPVHQVWRYTTADNGVTWTGEQITDEENIAYFPAVIAGAPEPRLTYTTGIISNFNVFDTRVKLVSSVTGESM